MFDSFPLDPLYLAILLAVCVIAVVVAVRARAADFTIDSRPDGRVRIRGRIPAAKHGAIRAFFTNDLRAQGTVRVRGFFGPRRSFRLRFAGRIGPGQQQQIRNFLMAELR